MGRGWFLEAVGSDLGVTTTDPATRAEPTSADGVRSIARQGVDDLGGSRSVLTRQRRDHARLAELITDARASSGERQDVVLRDLCRLVFPHAFAEEAVLWPAARRALRDGDALTLRIEQEHQEVNRLVTALQRCPSDDAGRAAHMERTFSVLDRDVRDEEDELLARLQAALHERALRRLGTAWELVRRTAPTRPHPAVSRRPPGNVLAALPLSALDRSRDRLDGLGRSSSRWVSAIGRGASAALATLGGAAEHVPGFRRGEHQSTHER